LWTGYEDDNPHTVKLIDPQRATDTIVYTYNEQAFSQYPPAFYEPGFYCVSVIVGREGYKNWIGSAVVEIREHESDPLAAPVFLTGNKGSYVSYGANRHQITWNAVENAVRLRTDIYLGQPRRLDQRYHDRNECRYHRPDLRRRGFLPGPRAWRRFLSDSEWSEGKTFAVCPMDINNDGDIGGIDRVILAQSWLAEEGEDDYIPAADIDGNGDVGGIDRAFLANNWLNEVGVDDMIYPRPKAADVVFSEFASADLAVDLDVF
jgi:hypothetical protein